jgi:hypothetical protein
MTARFALSAGETAGFSLRWAAHDDADPRATAPADVAARLADVAEAWRSWEAEHDIYEGRSRERVQLSARVLKGLTYRPTGAIVAAPTAGLPETVGGERNWDYRYAWVRDASLTVQALYLGACSDEADEFVSFMTSSAGGRVEDGLQISGGQQRNVAWQDDDRLGAQASGRSNSGPDCRVHALSRVGHVVRGQGVPLWAIDDRDDACHGRGPAGSEHVGQHRLGQQRALGGAQHAGQAALGRGSGAGHYDSPGHGAARPRVALRSTRARRASPRRPRISASATTGRAPVAATASARSASTGSIR